MTMMYLALLLAAAMAIGYFLPRFAVLVAGPAIFLGAAAFFVTYHPLFSFFNSHESVAGLIVPFLMWLVLGVACFAGYAMMSVGWRRMNASQGAERPSATPVADLSRYELNLELEKARAASQAMRVRALEAEIARRERQQ